MEKKSYESKLRETVSSANGNRERVKALGDAVAAMSEEMRTAYDGEESELLDLSERQLSEAARTIEWLEKVLRGDESEDAAHYARSASTAGSLFSFGDGEASINLPGNTGISVDGEGVKVDFPGGGVSVGKDGVSVDLPNGGRVGVGSDGKITLPDGSSYDPPFKAPTTGDGGSPGNLFEIPVPQFSTTPLQIPIPVPEFSPKPFPIPVPVPQFESCPLSVPFQLPQFQLPQLQFPNPMEGMEWLWSRVQEMQENVAAIAEEDEWLEALQFGLAIWKVKARFRNVKVMAIAAIGVPGCLEAPKMEKDLKNAPGVAGLRGKKKDFADAMAKAVSKNFEHWQEGVTIPGLPWYPMFVAFPGPEAPPMPNVPTPLIACVSGQMDEIVSPIKLIASMREALGDDASEHEDRIEKLGVQVASFFSLFLASTQVMNVLGKGSVPSFAPPAVPAGPVLNGEAFSVSGLI